MREAVKVQAGAKAVHMVSGRDARSRGVSAEGYEPSPELWYVKWGLDLQDIPESCCYRLAMYRAEKLVSIVAAPCPQAFMRI